MHSEALLGRDPIVHDCTLPFVSLPLDLIRSCSFNNIESKKKSPIESENASVM